MILLKSVSNIILIVLSIIIQFQTTAPKSCYMRPPGGILAPGENVIATGNLFFPPFLLNFFVVIVRV